MAAPGPRELLLACFEAALTAVDAQRCTRDALSGATYDGDWHVLAIGKAAGAMALGALERLGPRCIDGLVVTAPGHVPAPLADEARVRVIESAHPVPDARSLAAGEAVAGYVQSLSPRAQLLCLISGGASSLVERLVPGAELADLAGLNAWALASGLPINEVNALRCKLSTLKGGGLATLVGRRHCEAIFVSDVPRDDPAVIGSGLLHGSGGRASRPRIPFRVVASVRHACRAAAVRARSFGLEVHVARARFAGDAERVGARFARTLQTAAPGTLQVWGGESTMTLPAAPGYGGRNQHLALAAAVAFAGRRDVMLLAGGTDGVDGVTGDAGAIVDGATVERGADGGLDARLCLQRADSGRFLEASGDLLHTGPTLTNVGDLVLGWRGRKGLE